MAGQPELPISCAVGTPVFPHIVPIELAINQSGHGLEIHRVAREFFLQRDSARIKRGGLDFDHESMRRIAVGLALPVPLPLAANRMRQRRGRRQ